MSRLIGTMVLVCGVTANLLATDVPSYRIVSETSNDTETALVVNYVSMNADGTGTATLSGLISIPKTLPATAVLLDNHHTIASNSEAPSVAKATASAMLFRGKYLIVAPDYYGYGISKDKPHTYLCYEQNVANCIDFALVARRIIDSLNVDFVVDSMFNVGYSQGGGVAMVVHRALDKNPELANELHFSKSWCGAGPYDVSLTLNEILSGGTISYPVLLPMVIKGFMAGYPQCFAKSRKFSDFFNKDLIDAGLESWVDSKNLTTEEVSEKMLNVTSDNSIKSMLNPDVFDEKSVLRAELQAVADKNNLLCDWNLVHPMTLLHQPSDEVVPFINTQKAIEYLNLPANEQIITNWNLKHSSFGTIFYLYVAGYMEEMVKSINNDSPFGSEPNSIVEEPAIEKLDLNQPMYDISGRRVGKDYQGVVIQNGKAYVRIH